MKIFIPLFLFIGCMMTETNKAKLIYVGDPMCSWCYGISENLSAVKNDFKDKLDYELVMGGLRPYNKQVMTELKEFLTHHWEDVSKASGQEFNYKILDNDQITYDTEPPCRASVVIKNSHPALAFDFFHEVQNAFYQENKNLHLADSYKSICAQLNIPFDAFEQSFNSDEMKNLVKLDFNRSKELGVSSFPTIILEYKGHSHLIAKGFATQENMKKRIEEVIGN